MKNMAHWLILLLFFMLGCFFGCGGDDVFDNDGSIADAASDNDDFILGPARDDGFIVGAARDDDGFIDDTAPTVTGGSVEDGEEDLDPAVFNEDGIEITFSEPVVGNIALRTENGENVGWVGRVDGNRATLTPIAGNEIGNETVYVITGIIADAAGNETELSITFTTWVE